MSAIHDYEKLLKKGDIVSSISENHNLDSGGYIYTTIEFKSGKEIQLVYMKFPKKCDCCGK